MDNVKFSKRITYILRHDPYGAGLTPDKFGFVPIDKLLFALGKKFPQYSNITLEDIRNVMEDSEKKRFEIFGNLIRASYGHSFDVLPPASTVPPEFLYHGTVFPLADNILKEGLLPMKRKFVHLSSDIETAFTVGRRRQGKLVIFCIHAETAFESGNHFYRSNDSTWLSEFIAPEFIFQLPDEQIPKKKA